MQRVYKEDELGKVSKRIITGSSKPGCRSYMRNRGGDLCTFWLGLPQVMDGRETRFRSIQLIVINQVQGVLPTVLTTSAQGLNSPEMREVKLLESERFGGSFSFFVYQFLFNQYSQAQIGPDAAPQSTSQIDQNASISLPPTFSSCILSSSSSLPAAP